MSVVAQASILTHNCPNVKRLQMYHDGAAHVAPAIVMTYMHTASFDTCKCAYMYMHVYSCAHTRVREYT